MYYVKYGSEWLHDPRVEGVELSSLTFEAEENTCGYCTFTIDKGHPLLGEMEQRNGTNLITVYDDKLSMTDPYFQGFIYEIDTDFYLSDTVKCKGVLAYLSDSIVRPYSTLATESKNVAPNTPSRYFSWLLGLHNSQMNGDKDFLEGINQASQLDTNEYIYRSNSDYTTVSDEMQKKLLEELGGYLSIRYEGGARYLDYIAEWETANTQVLDFGVNLTDFTRTDDALDVVTCVIPLGAAMSDTKYSYNLGYSKTADTSMVKGKDYYTKDGDDYSKTSDRSFKSGTVYYEYIAANDQSADKLTISSLADGNVSADVVKAGDHVYSRSAVNKYGFIYGTYENSDITVRENLLTTAVSALGGKVSPKTSITIKAVDLSLISDKYTPIRIGEYVRVRSVPHNFDSYMLCTSVELDLVNPENSTYTLGFTYDTLTGQSNKRINALNATVNHVYQAADAISKEAKDAAQAAADASGKATEAADGVADLEQKFATLKGKFLYIRYSAHADGSDMTDAPTADTEYMGIYSGDAETAPEDASEYVWSLIKGTDGVGVKGDDGAPAYLHIKYSDDGTTFTANGGETAGEYIGTYSDNIKADSTTFSDYTWAKIRGEQGEPGIPGLQGERGEQGVPGAAGTSTYFHVAYATNSNGTTGFSTTDATGKTYIGTYVDSTPADSTSPSKYTWQLVKGAQGEKGEQGIAGVGEDGKTSYLHIKYSNDGGKTFTAGGGETVGDYIGTCTDFTQADPTAVASYTWAKIKGEQGIRGLQGEQGVAGPAGSDGKTTYFHIKYAPVASPTASQMTETPNVYIGTYVDNTEADSTSPSKYTWARFQGLQGEQGEQGIPGVGEDGKTTYLHIKYSDDGGATFTANSGEDAGDYIGTCTDFNVGDPTTVGAYKWARIKGDKGSVTFTDTPTTPYFVGDMWTVQASGDKLGEGTLPFALETRAAIYVCIKDSEGAFNMDDWSLAGTDDSVAQEAANNAAAALDTATSALQKALEDSNVVKIETLYSADGGVTWTTEQPTQ